MIIMDIASMEAALYWQHLTRHWQRLIAFFIYFTQYIKPNMCAINSL